MNKLVISEQGDEELERQESPFIRKTNTIEIIQQNKQLQTIGHVKEQHNNVQEKVNDLQINMNESIQEAKFFENKYFRPRNPKLKQVEEFLMKINEQKAKMKQKFQQARARQAQQKALLQLKRQRQEQIERQKQKQLKHEQKFVKQRLRKKFLDQNRQKQKQYRRFVKDKKPKFPSFATIENPEAKYSSDIDIDPQTIKLLKIKQNNTIDIQYLEKQQRANLRKKANSQEPRTQRRRYEEIQQQQEYLRRLHKPNVIREFSLRNAQLSENPKELQKLKRLRQLQYANRIRQYCSPEIDIIKFMQLQKSKALHLGIKQKIPFRLNRLNQSLPLQDTNKTNNKSGGQDISKSKGIKNLSNMQQKYNKKPNERFDDEFQEQSFYEESLDHLPQIRNGMPDGPHSEKIRGKIEAARHSRIQNYQQMKIQSQKLEQLSVKAKRFYKNADETENKCEMPDL